MVLGTVVTRSNIGGWVSILGLAFDGFRVHAMDVGGWHHVINRQNFVAQANQILGVVVVPVCRGLTFDGKHFWTINTTPSPDELVCYKLDEGVPHIIKTFALVGDINNGVAFDGKNLIISRGANIEFWNPQSEVMVDSFALGFQPRDLTFDGKYLWVCDGNNDIVYCINPISQAVITSFAFPPAPQTWPFGITFDGKYLWIGTWPNAAGEIYCVEKS